MKVSPEPDQTSLPIWSITAKLHFGEHTIMLPTMNCRAATLSAATDHMKGRNEQITKMIPDVHLELLAVERGPITICRSESEPNPIAELGTMMARSLIEWLQK